MDAVLTNLKIMESYDVFLMGNFVALDAFKREFGVFDPSQPVGKQYIIQAKWQSALQVSGQLGALIGVFIAGPLTSRIGYRWATMTGLMFLNAFIFIFYFGNSLAVFFVAQLLEGLPCKYHSTLYSAASNVKKAVHDTMSPPPTAFNRCSSCTMMRLSLADIFSEQGASSLPMHQHTAVRSFQSSSELRVHR